MALSFRQLQIFCAVARCGSTTAAAESIVQDVVTFAADIGLIEGPCHEPGLRVEPWLEDSLIVVAAPGHPLASRTQVSRESMPRRDSPLAGSGAGSAESPQTPSEGAAAMMHADLIDQDDFRERLQALGFSVPPEATPEQACEYAVRGLSPERAQALRRLVEDMLGGHATLLPAVREAISRQLLPALVPRG